MSSADALAIEDAANSGKDTYAHVLPEMQAEVVKVLDGVFVKKVSAEGAGMEMGANGPQNGPQTSVLKRNWDENDVKGDWQ